MRQLRHAIAACAGLLAAILAGGCGSHGGGFSGTGGALPQTPGRRQLTTSSLLYAATSPANAVYVFSYPQGKLEMTLTNIQQPTGACSDSAGNVFIPLFSGTILRYAHGGKIPIATLSDAGEEPVGCAVDPMTGNLAIANFTPSNVAIYQNASGSPAYYADPTVGSMFYCAYDDEGNLYVDGQRSGQFALDRLPYGSSDLENISFPKAIAWGFSIQWDAGALAVADTPIKRGTEKIYRVEISGQTAKISDTMKFVASPTHKFGRQFWIQGKRLVQADNRAQEDIAFWKYPKGGRPTKTIHHLAEVDAVTVSTVNYASTLGKN
jgi:hypothetical protein